MIIGNVRLLTIVYYLSTRWDMKTINNLPDYMKLCYTIIFEFYEEIKKEMIERGTIYRIQYVKEKVCDTTFYSIYIIGCF